MRVTDRITDVLDRIDGRQMVRRQLADRRAYAAERAPATPWDRPLDVESAEFREWFGASVLVDRDGKPAKLYHGTVFDFDAFDWDVLDGRAGFSLTTYRKQAEMHGDIILTAYVRVERPAIFHYSRRELYRMDTRGDDYDGKILRSARSPWIDEIQVLHPDQVRIIRKEVRA